MDWANNIQNKERVLMLSLGIGLCIVMMFPEYAFAGDGGKEFEVIWEQMCGWLKGGLGRLICGSTILVGVIFAIARQSLMTLGVGVGVGLILYNLPGLVKSIIGATIVNSSFGMQMLEIFSNGLN